jgi:hypothetical protein
MIKDVVSKAWSDRFCGLLRRHYRENFKLDNVAPIRDPVIEQIAISRFHDLKTTREGIVDPARNVPKTVRSKAPMITEATIHGDRIIVLEMFNDHVEHALPRLDTNVATIVGSSGLTRPS